MRAARLPIALAPIVFAASAVLLSASSPARTPRVTLERKLDILAGCGLVLAKPFTVKHLLTSFPRAHYEKPGFGLVLVGLGMTEERPPWRNHCVNLWHFDTECIEDNGDYVRIVKRMAGMTQGSLVLREIRDHVDVDARKAWFSFSHRGRPVRVNCKVDNDWVDPNVFAPFVRLLAQDAPSKVYIHYDLGGQDCIIGCVTRDELRRLNQAGVKFVPLT